MWCDDAEVSLRPKTLAVFRHLAANAGRLVSREELLRAAWGGEAVSPSVVRVSVREVREALGRDVVQTVGRQGYRVSPGAADGWLGPPTFVGRDGELARLHELLERCGTQRRQLVFVAGEPGIGKSALVEHFTRAVCSVGVARVVFGQCAHLHGSREPYMPVLDALQRLCQQEDGRAVRTVLNRRAPSWLLQMPSLLDDDTAVALRNRVPSPTRDRMLREFADAFEVLAQRRPLILVLEDLHWSDASTVDLLTYLAGRTTPAKLFVVGTYRPVEAAVSDHPLRAAVRDVLARRSAEEILVEPLSRREVETCLAGLLAGGPTDTDLVDVLYSRSDGNPLFLTAIVEHLVERGILSLADGRWQLGAGADSVPPSLRELVAREFEGLDADDRNMLAAASVAGADFDAASVAAACGHPLSRIEHGCARLSATGQLVRATGTTCWPDGTISGTFRFLHALHRDAVYERVPPAEVARVHRAIGERLEAGWSSESEQIAPVLALHFERGSDLPRAVHYHRVATRAAKARLADGEIVAHGEAALALLERLPPSQQRDQTEMECRLDLGGSLLAARAYGLPQTEQLFARARDLAVSLGNPLTEFLARGGLYITEVMGGHQRRALGLAEDLLAMAERLPTPLTAVIGHTTVGCASYNLGELIAARRHFELARDAWEPTLPRVQIDQKVLFLGIGALALQQLDDPAAASWGRELLAYAEDLQDPLNAAHAFNLMAPRHLWAEDRGRALECAERAGAIAAEHGFRAHEALARFHQGFALDDLSMQREGFASLQESGYRVDTPTHRLQMARTLLVHGRTEEAYQELGRALAAVEATGESRHLAEIQRARAACALAAGRRAEAEAALGAALSVAREQHARFFEKRALADLEGLATAS